ncbi:hypothetical protein GCM10023168_00200 [Fodinibacter luteus]|uniref:Uncharacterized protein n=1 Tax=Fodinibacter luteus TaxID=552064 RepID=A0ABP8JUS9_9MICO
MDDDNGPHALWTPRPAARPVDIPADRTALWTPSPDRTPCSGRRPTARPVDDTARPHTLWSKRHADYLRSERSTSSSMSGVSRPVYVLWGLTW